MKTYRILAMSVTVAVLMAVVPALGHHAPQGEFDLHKKSDVKGTVKRMEWVSPHPSLLVDVRDPKTGTVKTWQFEADGVSTMRRGGVGRNLLKFGDEVTVTYYPSFDGTDHGFIQALTTSDGKSYTVYFGTAEKIAEATPGR